MEMFLVTSHLVVKHVLNLYLKKSKRKVKNAILSSYQDDERSKGDTSQLHHLHHELQRSLVTASSIEEEPEDPVAPLKNPKDDSK